MIDAKERKEQRVASCMQQWDRTAAYVMEMCGPTCGSFLSPEREQNEEDIGGLGGTCGWWLGEIVLSTRHFRAGDMVVIVPANGGGERQQVYAVTSKGHKIREMFVRYGSSLTLGKGLRKEKIRLSDGRVLNYCTWRVDSHHRWVDRDFGPMRWVEHPRELEGLSPADAAIRRLVEAHVRARRMPDRDG